MGFKRSWVQIPPARHFSFSWNLAAEPGKMAVPPDMVKFQRLLPGVVALVLYALSVDGNSGSDSVMRLNTGAFNFARDMIDQGRFIADKKGEWTKHHPTRSEENAFIRDHGVSDYAKWHLALDERHGLGSKARSRFPFGDFQNVHRCGLLAVKARAHEYGEREIEDAAEKLLGMIESARPSRQKRID